MHCKGFENRWQGSGYDLIFAIIFTDIQIVVSQLDQFIDLESGNIRGNPEGHGNGYLCAFFRNTCLLDRCTDLFGKCSRNCFCPIDQKKDLLTAPAADTVFRPYMRADRIGNKNQYFISTFMSISVIYLFEIIYTEEKES